ncbi:peptidase domain-containing protein [Calothrix parasitica NIES-267]|uniref:Peptidase domain-containing protein n=1 Tax=Calothrix parasitica NIES-267 TaxID=1973488 RepID=A0A1Z4LUI6_9CYAN|nr:peptidase domain-containing protein [Calothrix parasitica NIES-267]
MADRNPNTTPEIEKKTSNSQSSVSINADATAVRDGEDGTDSVNGSNGNTTSEDETNPITDLTNSAPQEDVSEARRTESEAQQSLISISSINNGSFEGNPPEPGDDRGTFDNFRTIGDTSIETEDIGIAPTDAESQALITTGFSDSGGSVEESDLSEFLGLTSGSLDTLLDGNATEGSGIKQTFTAQAGDIIEFDYTLLTNEATPTQTFNDSAFFSLGKSSDDSSGSKFALEIADTSDPTFSDKSVEGYLEATDTKTIKVAISEAGTYELGFGIVDLSDSIVDSGILVDDVKLISTGVGPFSPSVEGTQTETDGAITSDVDFTFGNNGFEPASGSSNPAQ